MKDKNKISEQNLLPDKKQWFPLYGAYKMIEDSREGKPAINDIDYKHRFPGFVYHVLTFTSAGFGVVYGLEKLMSEIFL